MTHAYQQMRGTSLAFRHALLKSEKKRVGVIVFVCFFAVLAIVRIFVLGSAMSRWGLVVAALVIAFELGLYHAVNRSLHSGKDISNFVWYVSSILECLFPAVGVAFLAGPPTSARLSTLGYTMGPCLLSVHPLVRSAVEPETMLDLRNCLSTRIPDGCLRGGLALQPRTEWLHGDPDGCEVLRVCTSNHGRVGRRSGGRNPHAC
jgi:hypothetical protein